MTIPAVVARLRGGLGNQMFQYATALALARRHGGEVRLDWRGSLPGRAQPQLLRLQVDALPPTRMQALRSGRPALALARHQRWFARLARCHVEHGLRYDATLAAGRPPRVLDGYFQSERYFADARALLLRQFRPRAALAPAQQALARRIAAAGACSVAVLVRRGDYAHDPAVRAVHGLCDAAWYAAAARLAAERIGAGGAVRFFVFGDDPEWASAALALPGPAEFAAACLDTPEVNLHLMSLCRHHVCANSSYAWWGAWLAEPAGQVVVAPARWFASPDLDATDLIPPQWLRL